jgi:hypothetical protein
VCEGCGDVVHDNAQYTCPIGSRFQDITRGVYGAKAVATLISSWSTVCNVLQSSLQFQCTPCPASTYSLLGGASSGEPGNATDIACHPCSEGADCSSGDGRVVAAKGYWGTGGCQGVSDAGVICHLHGTCSLHCMLTYESLLVLVRALPEECLSSCVPPCAAVVSGIDANSTGVAHFLSCPELYCCEGKPSPDNPWPCDSISPCARNRTGPLCGHCVSGLTEVFGSPVCVPRRECSFSQVGCAQCLANVVVVVAATAVVVAVRHAHVLRVGVFVSNC